MTVEELEDALAFWRADARARLWFVIGAYKAAVARGQHDRAADIGVSRLMPTLAAIDADEAGEWRERCAACEAFIRPGDAVQAIDDGDERREVHARCGDPAAPSHAHGFGDDDAVIAEARGLLRQVHDEKAEPQSPEILVALKMARALADVAVERQRQISEEGWTAEHDDEHDGGALGDAAACYAATQRIFKATEIAGRGYEPFTQYSDVWPWEDSWWKPKDRRRDLVRAAALIVAEIERLDRVMAKQATAGEPDHG